MAPPAGYCHRRECGARGSPRASGSRRTPLPCPLGARGAGFPGSPGRSWILLLAKAGSEFRTVIPGGVTSEKFFFFSAEILVGAGKLLQNSKTSPLPSPHRSSLLVLLREATPHPLSPLRNSAGAKVTNEGKEIMSGETLKKLP